jgi:hypothetical protein
MREGAESPETGSHESEDAENLDETAKTDLMVYVVVADGLVVYRREARQLLLGLGVPLVSQRSTSRAPTDPAV